MRLFFDSNINMSGTHSMSAEESKHIIRVLRMNTGDTIGILDGTGNQFICEITEANPKDCLLYTSPSPRDRTRYRMPSSA